MYPFLVCFRARVTLPGGVSSAVTHSHPHSQTATWFTLRAMLPYMPPHIPCVCVCSPMTETSYSIRNRASWPLCINMVKASACLSLFKGIPSMLNTRSPALIVPSLENHRGINREQHKTQTTSIRCSYKHWSTRHSRWLNSSTWVFPPGEMKDKGDKQP